MIVKQTSQNLHFLYCRLYIKQMNTQASFYVSRLFVSFPFCCVHFFFYVKLILVYIYIYTLYRIMNGLHKTMWLVLLRLGIYLLITSIKTYCKTNRLLLYRLGDVQFFK